MGKPVTVWSEIVIKKRSFLIYFCSIGLSLSLLLAGNFRKEGLLGFCFSLFAYCSLYLQSNNLKNIRGDSVNKILIVNILFYFSYFLVSLLRVGNWQTTITDTMRYLMIFILAFVIYNVKISDKHTCKIFNILALAYFVIICFSLYMVKFQVSDLEDAALIGTQLGAFSFFVLGCIFLVGRHNLKLIAFFFFSFLLYKAQSRAALLSIIVFVLMYIVLKIFKNHFKVLFIFYWLIMAIYSFIPYVYTALSNPNSILGSILDYYVTKYSGHRMFSGRDIIWARVFEDLKNNWFLGRGIGYRITTTDIYTSYSSDLSTHNLFLHFTLQVGIVGLFLFLLFMFVLWKRWVEDGSEKSLVLASFLVALLFQQVFSLGLVSGKMGYAICCWSLLMLGASKNYAKKSGE